MWTLKVIPWFIFLLTMKKYKVIPSLLAKRTRPDEKDNQDMNAIDMSVYRKKTLVLGLF